MKIEHEEIERRRAQLEEKDKATRALAREEARASILESLAKKEYEGILEKASEFDINLPQTCLQEAADLYAKSQLSRKLVHAQKVYRSLGDNKKAESLDERIEAARVYERADDIAISYGL